MSPAGRAGRRSGVGNAEPAAGTRSIGREGRVRHTAGIVRHPGSAGAAALPVVRMINAYFLPFAVAARNGR